MADDPKIPPEVPNKPAGTSPQVQARTASDEDLVEVKVYGKTQLVPVRLVKQDYQTSSAGRAAIEEAKRIRAEAHVDRDHAERWRSLEIKLRRDPDTALRELAELAGVTREGQDGGDIEKPSRQEPRTRALEERLEQLERVHNQDRLKATLGQALDQFPMFKVDARAREFAEKQILALQVIDPGTDPLEAARDIHTDLVQVRGVAATQQRDERMQRENSMPTIPANAGMPDLSDIPQAKAGDLRNGNFRKNIETALARFSRTMTGN